MTCGAPLLRATLWSHSPPPGPSSSHAAEMEAVQA